jgi:hypothetical protein
VPALRPDFYPQWRAQQETRFLLREHDSLHSPERLLQNIWHHQRHRRDELRAADGQPLRILHPGFWNHGAGLDFHGIDTGMTAVAGDMESILSIICMMYSRGCQELRSPKSDCLRRRPGSKV